MPFKVKMHFLNNYTESIVKYDLINKFNYRNLNKIPKLEFLTLTFKLQKYDIKTLISASSAIEIITSQKSVLNYSKVSNVSLKIRKGQPVGCKATLRKQNLNYFLYVLINTVPPIKNDIRIQKNVQLFSISINNILIFKNLENNYPFFKKLSNLNVNLTTNCDHKELLFILKSNKLLY